MKIREILNLYETTNVRVGYIGTDNLSNELDSITVVLTNVSKMAIESDDIVEFTDENNSKTYWLVGNVNKNYTTFKAPFLYEYTLDLVSPTKLLEIPIPSQSITYHEGATDRTLYHYIRRAYYMYFKMSERYDGIVVSLTSMPFVALYAYNNGHAPESKVEKPTLREYLDYLFNFIGYISKIEIRPRITNPVTASDFYVILEGFNLNPTGSEISTDYIVEINENQQAESYITSLQQDMDEVITPNPIKQKIRFSCDAAIINEKNALLMTQYKLYDIKAFNLVLDGSDAFYNTFHLEGQGYKRDLEGSGVNATFEYYLGVEESDLTLLHSNYYEIVTVNQAKTEMWRCITNAYENDDLHNDPIWKKLIKYTWSNNNWSLVSVSYTKVDTSISNYYVKVIRDYSTYAVGTTDYIIIPKATLDLSPYVLKKELYDALNMLPQGDVERASSELVIKNNSFYWERGSTKIDGLLEYQNRSGIFGVTITDPFSIVYAIRFASHNYVQNLITSLKIDDYAYALKDAGDTVHQYEYKYSMDGFIEGDTISANAASYNDVKDWTFEIEYLAYASFKIICEKEGARHKVYSMDANTNISTDVLSEIKRSKQKVKQLANPNLILNGFSVGSAMKMAIGDYIDLEDGRYTLISLETEHDNSSNVYKGILSKNYSNQVINTIINREKRYYSIPDPSESVVRHEKIEYKITAVDNSTGLNIKCNYAIVKLGTFESGLVTKMEYCILPVTSVFSKDNHRITYTLDFGSNAIYGYMPTNTEIYDQGGNQMLMLKYTDDYAEKDALDIMFVWRDKNKADDMVFYDTSFVSNLESLISSYSSALPKYMYSLDNNSKNKNEQFLKDAREHLVISLDLIFDETLEQSVENAFNSDYSGTYDKYTITT